MAATLVSGVAVAPPLWAASNAQQQQVNKQMSQLRGDLTELTADEAELLGLMDELNNRKAELDAKVADVQGRMNQAQAELDAANQRLAEIQARIDEAQAKLEAAQAALDASTQRMRDQAINAYMGTKVNADITSLVLQANDMREVSAASEYLGQVVKDKRRIVEEHKELEAQANDARRELDEVKAKAQQDRDVIAARTAELTAQKAQLEGLNAELDKQAQDQAALLNKVEQKKASIQAQLDALQAQSDAIAQQLRSISPSTPGAAPPPSGKGVLGSPLPGVPMNSRYGMRVNPVTGRHVLHAGQDYAARTGTPIRAAADGTVVSVIPTGSSGGYGNYTCINHGGGLATCYAHQSQTLVSPGQRVTRGQIIGLVGSTGNSTGPHLHFEVRVNGNPVDPIGYL